MKEEWQPELPVNSKNEGIASSWSLEVLIISNKTQPIINSIPKDQKRFDSY
jgi:hypothetical protein